MKLFDCHVHFPDYKLAKGYLEMADEFNYSGFNVVCTPHPTKLTLVPEGLYLKSLRPDSIYVYGGLDIGGLFTHPKEIGTYFSQYVDTLINMGCDGIKMIEGKPNMKRDLRFPPFDAEILDPYWQKLEQVNFPVLFHLNDPAEFWDIDKISPWAKNHGWYYGEGCYPNNEAQYTEVHNVLTKHPNLKIIFAHFLFFSDDLDRLSDWLDSFPNIMVDLTPGIEMYINFSKDIDKAKDFFIKYQDRILFGTDIGIGEMFGNTTTVNIERNKERINVIKHFLMSSDDYKINAQSFPSEQGVNIKSLNLSKDILTKIMNKNFKYITSESPNKLDINYIIGECTRLIEIMKHIPPLDPNNPIDNSAVLAVKKYFERG